MQLAVNIVVLAAIYALIACGYVLVYRVSRVLNLAHGELMMLGAYLLVATASLFSGHPLIAGAAALALSLLVSVLVYVLLMQRMTGEMVLAAALATVALGILLRGVVVLVWSAQQQDRKSTRLNSSHLGISYAVFCLKKKREKTSGA